jgi:hypothetical protein
VILFEGKWDPLLKCPTMNHNYNHDHAKSEGPHSLPVRFAVTDSTVGSVLIAGTFNNRQPEAKPMHPMGKGRWVRRIVLPLGTYKYCLVVDRTWTPDPLAQETVPNPRRNELGPEGELADLKQPTAQTETFARTRKNK